MAGKEGGDENWEERGFMWEDWYIHTDRRRCKLDATLDASRKQVTGYCRVSHVTEKAASLDMSPPQAMSACPS